MAQEYWRASSKERARTVNSVPVLLLDGAMGTWLEDHYGQIFDETKPAWSSSVDPEYIRLVHDDYLKAGADIILTATYQATPENMASKDTRAAISGPEARMRSLVTDALDSIKNYRKTSALLDTLDGRLSLTPATALSLSAYGGTMKPSTEYTGEYPGGMTDAGALSRWHGERLAVYARRNDNQDSFGQETDYIWDDIQYVAFETLVSTSEVVAAGKAMGSLQHAFDRKGREHMQKRFWTCVNYPDRQDGRILTPCGDTPDEVVRAMLMAPDNSDNWSVPWGIGINCTKIQKIPQLVDEYEKALFEVRKVDGSLSKPWLVLYPDGASNLRYNPQTKQWDTINPDHTGQKGNLQSWASQMMTVLEETTSRAEWAGIVVGGCCKTTPADIGALTTLIEQHDSKTQK